MCVCAQSFSHLLSQLHGAVTGPQTPALLEEEDGQGSSWRDLLEVCCLPQHRISPSHRPRTNTHPCLQRIRMDIVQTAAMAGLDWSSTVLVYFHRLRDTVLAWQQERAE